jgi:serine/threonine-protein kinase
LLTCPTCQQHFAGEEQFCPRDGSPLSATSDAPSDPLLGRVLGGRYRLLERLGQGGMGTVFRALHTLMDKQVAVKILRAEMSSDGEAVARFHREARSASRLDHDHCIRVTDFGQSNDGDGLLYLVMELLDGVSLGQVVRRGPVPAARAAAIGAAVAEALAHAHEQGVVHRDLKPDNVFLARRPRGRELVKVLDFGLAKLMSDSALGAPDNAALTRDGTVFGTPEYMAPEQAEGEKLDGRTDLYALGVILYQLVTGDVPFRASNFVALLTKQVSEPPLPPRARRPDLDIPVELEAVILRCLEKRPDQRYTTADALAEALEPIAERDPSHLMLLPSRARPASQETSADDPATDRPSHKLHATPPGTSSPGVSPGVSPETSVDPLDESPGEVPQRSGRKLVLVAGGLAMLAAAATTLLFAEKRAPRPAPAALPSLTAGEAPHEKIELAEKLIQSGDLIRAEAILQAEKQRADSSRIEEALAVVAERQEKLLAALGHLEKAARLQPKDPEPRARLAALLLRAGDPSHACKQAREALKLDPQGTRSGAARVVVAQAHCSPLPLKEAP